MVSDKRPKEQYVRPTDLGLPGEEYKLRKERHNSRLLHTHLDDLYARHSLGMKGPLRRGQLDAWGPNPGLPYKKPIDTANQGKRPPTKYTNLALQGSQIAKATRQALGPSWYPTAHLDDGLGNHGVPHMSSDRSEQMQAEDPIPDKYVHEFNRLWYEDDEDNDADQLLADLTPNAHAPWRNHLPLRPMYGPDGEFRTSSRYFDKTEIMEWNMASYKASVTHREVIEPKHTVRPKPQSFFSWSDSSREKSQKKKHSRGSSHGRRAKKGF
ncbi:hypothetical protein P171DRAFT_442079 [Karstenula rhodostoma CBS 690.94]|uniref:Uncharacterized protein n=1 Tax=Karstenula rhodostoma CBS 690.94 TaxID=1392251 RepID=A0A9P4PPG5_9PLEO|nr:hypothetical protein P171DRAFT_442079 [Karstenula rhodostoma CBS 690.94]